MREKHLDSSYWYGRSLEVQYALNCVRRNRAPYHLDWAESLAKYVHWCRDMQEECERRGY